jgi:hypothetical protein
MKKVIYMSCLNCLDGERHLACGRQALTAEDADTMRVVGIKSKRIITGTMTLYCTVDEKFELKRYT